VDNPNPERKAGLKIKKTAPPEIKNQWRSLSFLVTDW